MATIRENPLPKGRYWLYLIGEEQRGQFEAGKKGLNEAHPGLVTVVATTHHNADETGSKEPETDWILFDVSSPAIWDFQRMGSPTEAGKDVTTESDIKSRPEPEKDPLDKLHDELESMGSIAALARGAFGVIIGVAVASGIVLLVSSRKSR